MSVVVDWLLERIVLFLSIDMSVLQDVQLVAIGVGLYLVFIIPSAAVTVIVWDNNYKENHSKRFYNDTSIDDRMINYKDRRVVITCNDSNCNKNNTSNLVP